MTRASDCNQKIYNIKNPYLNRVYSDEPILTGRQQGNCGRIIANTNCKIGKFLWKSQSARLVREFIVTGVE